MTKQLTYEDNTFAPEFPTLDNNQYKELYYKGKYDEIVENSYRLICKIVAKHGIRFNDHRWEDCFSDGKFTLISIVKDWNPDISQWSTYCYWSLMKSVQNTVIKYTALSYGCYDSMIKEHEVKVSTATKLKGQKIISDSLTVEDLIESTSLDPYEELDKKEQDAIESNKLKVITSYLDEVEMEALVTLFYNDSVTEEDLPWLVDNFMPYIHQYADNYNTANPTQRNRYSKKSISYTVNLEEIQSSSYIKGTVIYYWRKMFRKHLKKLIELHKDEL